MSRLSIVSDTLFRAKDIASHLPDVFETRCFTDDLSRRSAPQSTTISIDAHIPDLKSGSVAGRKHQNPRLVSTSSYQAVQANDRRD